ncbi:MAG TPA: response regulator [Candidatus Limnocylindrales bacterium]|nr:response regulator [Candidatus Limnocylindrales bacterium]
MGRWMIVEDEPDLYDMLLTMTDLMGVDGVAFANGEDAVAWIEDVEAKRLSADLPDLALLDMRLPGAINGEDVGARLRSSSILSEITVVLMTAYSLNPKQERAVLKYSGAEMLIYKPLPRMSEFTALMKKATAKRKRRNYRKRRLPPSVLPME